MPRLMNPREPMFVTLSKHVFPDRALCGKLGLGKHWVVLQMRSLLHSKMVGCLIFYRASSTMLMPDPNLSVMEQKQ